jgi:hypothetical protein
MTLHDWTRLDGGGFHSFHMSWIVHLTEALNGGLLPVEFYAHSENHFGRRIADVLTLREAGRPGYGVARPLSPDSGAVAVAERPPKVSRRFVYDPYPKGIPRTVTVRATGDDRVVAMIEIVSPGNKRSKTAIAEFVAKAREAVTSGIHFVILDVFRPGRHDPQGMHGALWADLGHPKYRLPADRPITFASYDAGYTVVAYVNHLSIGSPILSLPLFLVPDYYVDLPLADTYQQAVRGMGKIDRDRLVKPAR